MEFDLRLDSPNFESTPKIVIQLFVVTNSFLPLCLNNITHNITHNTYHTQHTFSMTPPCMPPKLNLYLSGCSRPLFGSYTGSESSFTSLSKRKSLNLVKDKTKFSGSKCLFSIALVTKKHKYFPGICDAAGGKAATPPIPGLCFQRNSLLLYSLLMSAANAVLKLMSAVVAIAHVLFVSMKSLSVSIMLLELSFVKLKYDSTTLPMSGFYGSSPISASKSHVSLAIINFFINKFSVWVSPTPTPRTKISIDAPSIAYRISSRDWKPE